MSDLSPKAMLRQHYRAARRAIPPAERERRSALVAAQVLALPQTQQARSVFIYLATPAEVQTRGLIAALLKQGKTVAVPRMLDQPGAMLAVQIHSLAEVRPGRYHLDEPVPDATHPLTTTPDLTIVPGLAFTQAGDRLGQGGGYYDRYLAHLPATYKIGLCFEEQVAMTLPTDPHDIIMHQIITG